MDQHLSQPDEHSSHPRGNSIPSVANHENSQQGSQQGDRGGRPPSDKFTLRIPLYIFFVLLFASIASGDLRSAVLNAIIGYAIVYAFDHLRGAFKK